MRRKASEPRRGDNGAPRGMQVDPGSSGRTTVGKVLRGLSSKAGLADLAALAAQRAEERARQVAQAAGSKASTVREAGRHARAEAIRETAKRAGVSEVTARRWVRGSQAPSAASEKAGRSKQQRAMGGAKGVRAERVSGTGSVDVGSLVVLISSGGRRRRETRNMGRVRVDSDAMEEVAARIREGDEQGAAELFEDALLEGYGSGLSQFMQIVDLPDPTVWD